MTTDDNAKELDEQLIQNETDSHPPRSLISKTKTRAQITDYLGDFIVKNVYGNAIMKSVKREKHVMVKHFLCQKLRILNIMQKPTRKTTCPNNDLCWYQSLTGQ